MGQTPATDNKKTCDTGEGSPPSAKSALSHSIFDWKKGKFPSILIKVSPSGGNSDVFFALFPGISHEFPYFWRGGPVLLFE
jgi:hypothetical protein